MTNEVGKEVAESRENNWEVSINYARKDNGTVSNNKQVSEYVGE